MRATLADVEGLDLDHVYPSFHYVYTSFHHDVLLGGTVRQYDRTPVSDNAADLARIQRYMDGFPFTLPLQD